MLKLCFASNNPHKLSEVRPLLGEDFSLLSLADIGCDEELPETKETIEGNSRQKAVYVFERFKIPCFADDTGLEVEALHNAPGVYSARYAGDQKNSDDNISLLLKNIAHSGNRKARFKTVMTLAGPFGVYPFEGILTGEITTDLRGAGGFGYDPVFLPKGFDKTLGEMTPQEKNVISHRAKAIEKLVVWLKANRGKLAGL